MDPGARAQRPPAARTAAASEEGFQYPAGALVPWRIAEFCAGLPGERGVSGAGDRVAGIPARAAGGTRHQQTGSFAVVVVSVDAGAVVPPGGGALRGAAGGRAGVKGPEPEA